MDWKKTLLACGCLAASLASHAQTAAGPAGASQKADASPAASRPADAPPAAPQAALASPAASQAAAIPAPAQPGAAPGLYPYEPLDNPAPEYPQWALEEGITGTVIVLVRVDKTGTPIDVQVERSSHSRSLDRAAVSAVRNWHFHPPMRNGVPVEAMVQVPIVFDLPPRPAQPASQNP